MKLLKRLSELSVFDLHRLQKAIMSEVLRRKELADEALATDGLTVAAEPDQDDQPASSPEPASKSKGVPRRRAA